MAYEHSYGAQGTNRFSRFWMGNRFDNWKIKTSGDTSNQDLMKLSSIKKSIANFVRILTNENIPVKFQVMRDGDKGTSGTSGKEVLISSDLSNFDVTCGLALHEGTHCMKQPIGSDFNLIKKVIDSPMSFFPAPFVSDLCAKYTKKDDNGKWVKTSKTDLNSSYPFLKSIHNWLEDRRIDTWTYINAPGYRGYYTALYDEYFNSKEVGQLLESKEFRTADWNAYNARLINITNPKTDLDALPGLREIWNLIDLANISRLKNSEGALKLAVEVITIIEKYTPPVPLEDMEKEGEGEEGDESKDGKGKGDGKGKPGDMDGKGSSEDEAEETEEERKANEEKAMTKEQIEEENEKRRKEEAASQSMDKKDKEKAKEQIQKQKDLINGKTDKKGITQQQSSMVEAIDQAGTTTKEVNAGVKRNTKAQKTMGNQNQYADANQGVGRKIKVVVVRDMTKGFIETDPFKIFARQYQSSENEKSVREGIVLGTQLGRKLQIRNEERTTKFTRLNNGKMDKRLIHGLGYGAEQVFEQTMIERFNPVFVHLSIDASGSMDGSKWFNTQKAVVAIAKAASMVSNLNVQISYRMTQHTTPEHLPLMLIAYDSRKDSFNKVKTLFKHLEPNGTTPESLCFAAIEEEIISGGKSHDSFFINFSDGAPGFSNGSISYGGDSARRHTREQVNKMTRRGINVMSYFISGGWGGGISEFKEMYGKHAVDIQVDQLVPLAKTLNKMFSTKNND